MFLFSRKLGPVRLVSHTQSIDNILRHSEDKIRMLSITIRRQHALETDRETDSSETKIPRQQQRRNKAWQILSDIQSVYAALLAINMYVHVSRQEKAPTNRTIESSLDFYILINNTMYNQSREHWSGRLFRMKRNETQRKLCVMNSGSPNTRCDFYAAQSIVCFDLSLQHIMQSVQQNRKRKNGCLYKRPGPYWSPEHPQTSYLAKLSKLLSSIMYFTQQQRGLMIHGQQAL